MYALPSDGADRQLDTLGVIAGSVGSFQAWLDAQTEGRFLRLDTSGGDLDVTFARLPRADAAYAARGVFARDDIEADLKAAGLITAGKIYAVYYDGSNPVTCGGAAWPGILGVLYLAGTPPGAPPCASNAFRGAEDPPGYLEYGMLHEIVHVLGFVATCAPHHTLAGHVSDATNDLMWAGDAPWKFPAMLDVGRDDYYGHHRSDCLDLADSEYLKPPRSPPNWSANQSTDFDGDRLTDLGALYRGLSPADSLWFAPASSGVTPFQIYFAATGDIPVPGDYNGDGKTDAVVFRPSTGLWYGPQTGAARIVIQQIVGQAGDIPIPGDYDGDGTTDPAVYRPSTGMFFAVKSGGGVLNTSFGGPGDTPVPRDYDGDGKTDPAIYRPNASAGLSLWYAPLSGGGAYQIYFGNAGDVPVPGDYNGDKRADPVIFRPTSGLWYGPLNGAPGLFQLILGGPGDIPIPGYYDGNLIEDPAIYRGSTGLWFALKSSGGIARIDRLGVATDVPVQKRPALPGGL